jgi:hypothetical protein
VRPRGIAAVDVGVVEEADAVEDEALLGRGLSLEHLVAPDHARVLWMKSSLVLVGT